MIVSIHNHVITRQSRFSVTHDSHKTWTLHVTGVLEEDRGHYMCQVNTAPMISQTGYLQVVVPPNIVDKASSKSNIVVREKENVTLKCRGDGFPAPQIKWRREDSKPIETSDGRKVHQVDGPTLRVRQVSRTHMGAYLCIATNGVPPSVSKRITLDVEFAPQMHVPNQLVGAPLGTEVHLECFVEAHPRAITYWEYRDAMVMNTSRVTTHTLEDNYKIHMVLNIRNLQEGDFGMYKCISKNSIAETDGSITLNKDDHTYQTRPGRKNSQRKHDMESSRRLEEEKEEEERRREEDRRRNQERERKRLEHDYKRGHRNEQATRVTHAPAGVSGGGSLLATPLAASCLLAYMIALFLYH
ncbi:lachesin-like isoform X2 [Homarus americanus]|uniref:lachesin-like isoform X2 n=1 Tax=Homarus americanus TaxID=6706 RepID=UPI001C43F24C|nr:lachesin-like isoform X2 [Homarus americanus]